MSFKDNYPLTPPTLSLDFVNSATIDPRVTFARSSTATYCNPAGLLTVADVNVPRIDYDPITHECKGLLIEEQRTNLLTYSEQFDNAVWTKGVSVTIAANSIAAPDGTLTADKAIYTAPAIAPSQIISSSTITYTISAYVKSGNTSFCRLRVGTAIGGGGTSFSSHFNLSNGTVSSTGTATADFGAITPVITQANNGWYRISVTFTVLSDTTSIIYGIVPAQTSGGSSAAGDEIYIWGAQLEAGAFPTSYIPTTSAQVIRAADNASMAGTNFSKFYNSTQGTLIRNFTIINDKCIATAASKYATGFTDGTSANNMFIRVVTDPTTPYIDAIGNTLSVTQFDTDNTTLPNPLSNITLKQAFAYSANDIAVYYGTTLSTDTSATIPTVNTMYLLGANETSVGAGGSAYLKNITYYPIRLTNAQLQTLTNP